MNDSKNSSNGLLVLRYPERLSMEKIESLIDLISPMADVLGVEPLVLDGGADARLEYGTSTVLERICTALEEIAAQGRMPEVNVAEIAPQALNARPTGLNSRPNEFDKIKADLERAAHEREHRGLGEFVSNLGKPTDG